MPGTLIISEAVQISPQFVGRDNAPGIWSPAQISAWRHITDAVHAKGCFIWCQLWAQGRTGNPDVHRRLGHDYSSASSIPHSPEAEIPKEMTEGDISDAIQSYRQAARNAIAAGFDGVEVHGGNGYLPDQFLQDVSNQRKDKWGGNIQGRCRFHLEVMKTISAEVGSQRAAVRLSPWSDFMGMGMEDPVPTFTYLVEQLRGLDLAFLDLIEARIRGNDDADCGIGKDVSFLVHEWCKDNGPAPVLLSGGFSPESAKVAVDETYKDYQIAVMFGRYWTSNPDLVYRIRQEVSLVKYDRSTFYTPKKAEGYIDWDFSEA